MAQLLIVQLTLAKIVVLINLSSAVEVDSWDLMDHLVELWEGLVLVD